MSLSQTGGGGGGPPPPHREASTTSINDAPLQSLLQRRNLALANPQPVGKAGFDGVGSRTRPFVRGPRLPSRVGSCQRQLCRPPYHIQHPVSTRPSRLVGGVFSFERGLPLSGVPARGPSGLGPASGCVRAVSLRSYRRAPTGTALPLPAVSVPAEGRRVTKRKLSYQSAVLSAGSIVDVPTAPPAPL